MPLCSRHLDSNSLVLMRDRTMDANTFPRMESRLITLYFLHSLRLPLPFIQWPNNALSPLWWDLPCFPSTMYHCCKPCHHCTIPCLQQLCRDVAYRAFPDCNLWIAVATSCSVGGSQQIVVSASSIKSCGKNFGE